MQSGQRRREQGWFLGYARSQPKEISTLSTISSDHTAALSEYISETKS